MTHPSFHAPERRTGPYSVPRCPECGGVVDPESRTRRLRGGETYFVDRVCRACGWVDKDTDGGV